MRITSFVIYLFLVILSSSLHGREVKIHVHVGENSTPQSVIIPFSKKSRLIMFRADIEGHRGNLILDTGASGLVLNSKYFDGDGSAVQAAMTAVGLVENIARKRIDHFSIDDILISRLDADIIDLKHIEKLEHTKILGLVGYEVLKDFEIFLNYHQQFIRLTRTSRKGNLLEDLEYITPKIDSVKFSMGNHIPIIPMSLSDKVMLMGLDTGAEYNLLNLKTDKKLLENFKISRRLKLRGAQADFREALGGHLYRLKLNNIYGCGAMATVLTGFKDIEKIVGRKIDGILGYEFLSPWMFSINYKKRMLYLHKITFQTP